MTASGRRKLVLGRAASIGAHVELQAQDLGNGMSNFAGAQANAGSADGVAGRGGVDVLAVERARDPLAEQPR